MSYYSAVLLLVLASAVAVNAQTCTSRSKYVGFTGKLTMIDHMIGGDVRITNACAFTVSKFTYDGRAPTVFWHCAKGIDKKSLRATVRASDQQVKNPAKGITVTFKLNKGITFDNCPFLLAWCESAKANFGYVQLKPSPKMMG